MPSRAVPALLGAISTVKYRPCARSARSKTRVNSARRRTRWALVKRWEGMAVAGLARGRRCSLRFRRNREPLAPFGAPALQHETAVLGRHAHQKPMGPATVPTIRLESNAHDLGFPAANEGRRRNLDSNQALSPVSMTGLPGAPVVGFRTVCYSRLPCGRRRVSPRSFPQLWKKMWKSQGFPAAAALQCSRGRRLCGGDAKRGLIHWVFRAQA